MEIRVLEYFLAVAREQSFSKAAEALHLTQPTLSRQLKDLEEELGKPLFIRSSKRLTLTDDGMILRKRAEEIIGLVKKTENEINNDSEQLSGDIYIGAGETEAVRILAKCFKNLIKEHPDLHLNITSGDGIDVLYNLDKGLIDLGLVLGDIDTTKYDFMNLPATDTWGILMRKDSTLADKEYITAEDLAGKPLIISRQVLENQEMNNWFGDKLGKLNIVATYNLAFNASIMAQENIGYVLTIERLINTANSNLKFTPLSPTKTIDIKLIWKKYHVQSKAVQRLLQEIKKTADD